MISIVSRDRAPRGSGIDFGAFYRSRRFASPVFPNDFPTIRVGNRMKHQLSTVTDCRACGIGTVEDPQELKRRFNTAYPRHRSLAKVEARVRFPYPAPLFREEAPDSC